MQQAVEQDIWEPKTKGRKCRRKHVWVYYHGHGFRECLDCPARQNLREDFGIVKKHKQD
jgi:hypothetical protein